MISRINVRMKEKTSTKRKFKFPRWKCIVIDIHITVYTPTCISCSESRWSSLWYDVRGPIPVEKKVLSMSSVLVFNLYLDSIRKRVRSCCKNFIGPELSDCYTSFMTIIPPVWGPGLFFLALHYSAFKFWSFIATYSILYIYTVPDIEGK